jgi:hypothetical protein
LDDGGTEGETVEGRRTEVGECVGRGIWVDCGLLGKRPNDSLKGGIWGGRAINQALLTVSGASWRSVFLPFREIEFFRGLRGSLRDVSDSLPVGL